MDLEQISLLVTNNNYSTIMDNFFQIRRTLKLICNRLSITDTVSENCWKDENISKCLPLKTIQDLIEMDEILAKEKNVAVTMCNKMRMVGGRNEKQFLKRNLATIFHNSLSSMCSWTGQKGNFKISDTIIIGLLRNASKTCYPTMTDKEFENIIKDWFRFGRQRLTLEAKKKKLLD